MDGSTPTSSLPPRLGVVGCVVAAAVSATQWSHGQCDMAWASFPGGGTDGQPDSLLAFDPDGTGPAPAALFVGGSFYKAGGAIAPHLARWDGSDWSGVGGGTGNIVYEMAIFDDDGPGPHSPALYACGSFTDAGGVPANRIARWDGSSWSALGSGLSNVALSMAVFDDDGAGPAPASLYVGGVFSAAGGAPAARIARWNGSSWSAVGTGFGGVDAAVGALAVFDDDGPGPVPPALYAAGSFTTAGPVEAKWIARWNGTAWTALGSGLSASFTSSGAGALAVFDEDGPGPGLGALFAGGSFDNAGGLTAYNIARWNGSAWSTVGGGVIGGSSTVTSLLVHDDDGQGPHVPALYAAGGFTLAGGVGASSVAKWNGTAWSAVGIGMGGGYPIVNALASFDEDGSGPAAPNLFAAGSFDSADNLFADHIARWDGAHWLPVGFGINGYNVAALALHDEDGDGASPHALYAGGGFDAAGGQVTPGVARYDGTNWSDVGGGVEGFVETLTTFDSDGPGGAAPWLVAGGAFISAGGNPTIRKVAAWNGTSWLPFGNGMGGGTPPTTVHALGVWDQDGPGPLPGELYAGGEFTFPTNRIARWTGTVWAPLGSGMNDTVFALAVFDEDGPGPAPEALYAAGAFTVAGGLPLSHFARWDGTTWSDVDGGVAGTVYAMTVSDPDGGGPEFPVLYLGGNFGAAGGVPALRVARWSGGVWSALGSGMNDWVMELELADVDGPGPQPAELYAAGLFSTAGGTPANHIARWSDGAWAPLGSGLDGNALALAARSTAGPDTLYIGGTFASADGISSAHIAAWGPAPPVIEQQPLGHGVGIGAAVTFSVAATGVGDLAYQWRHEGVPLTDGGNIAGATTSLLSIDPVTAQDSGHYDVITTDECASATSKTALLLVAEAWDLNLDGQVDMLDLLLLLGSWGDCPAPEPCPADVDGDGQVGVADLLLVLGHWG